MIIKGLKDTIGQHQVQHDIREEAIESFLEVLQPTVGKHKAHMINCPSLTKRLRP